MPTKLFQYARHAAWRCLAGPVSVVIVSAGCQNSPIPGGEAESRVDRVSPAADSLSRLLRAQLYSPDPAAAVQAVTCEMTRMVDRLGEEVADVEIRRAVQQFERSLTPKDREEYERVQNLLDGQYLTFGCNPPAKSGESNGTGSRAVERSGAPPTMEKRGEVPPR